MNYEEKFALEQRRNFLKFLGKTGVALPWLQSSILGAGALLGQQALAQGSVLRKVIMIYVPDGTPGGASHSFTPSAGMTLKTCSTPFETVKNQCIFFNNLEIDGGGGHGNTQRVLGAFAPGVKGTLDLALEGSVGSTSPIASLRLGIRTRGADPISARAYAGSTDFQDNPKAAFDKLFGGTVDASPIGAKREKKIHDVNQAALAKIRTKLGTYEKERLDQHEAAIIKLKNDIDKSTGSTAPSGCTNPTFNPGGLSTELVDSAFTDLFALQTENIILAMKCNITRIATIQIGTHQSDFAVTGLSGDYHTAVHSGQEAPYAGFRRYFSERVAHLIKRLQETDDPAGGKMIDSTLVLQVTDMGDGNAHGGTDAPFMMAGGGSAVNRGRVVTVTNHHKVLDAVAQYMGVFDQIPRYDASGVASGILV
jgi:Protein of unknown function (DUF1552)